MKKLPLLLLASFCYSVLFAQFGPTAQWTWMKGSKSSGAFGTYSGPPSSLTPGARDGSATWVGTDGQLWLFGGLGYSLASPSGYLNDLWVFDPKVATTNYDNWTFVAGDNTTNQSGVYGTMGTPAPTNKPGARRWAMTWVDGSGNLWMFGGIGYDGSGTLGNLSDLWEYDITNNVWTWVNGSNTANTSGSYPALGNSNPANANGPGGRYYGITFRVGNVLYLFSGFGYDGAGNTGYLNDLWSFDTGNNTWTYVNGSNLRNQFGTYSGTTLPGSRLASYTWYYNNKLYLFGGFGYGQSTGTDYLNDLWQYDPTGNTWTFVGGNNEAGATGNYGTAGVVNAANFPGGRSSGVSWMDNMGNLGIFGGRGRSTTTTSGLLNDVWRYNINTGQWIWEKGDDTNLDQLGVYGSQGLPDGTSKPGARRYVVGWTDTQGSLWLFGGTGLDDGTNTSTSGPITDYLNDLWKISNLVLPVKYVSFNATRASGSVLLDWTTAQEINSSLFVVEHSTDGSHYTAIGSVAAAGNTSQRTTYHFVDPKPQAGMNYYRLKLVNIDGSAEYSDVRTVQFATGPMTLRVLGNPFQSSIQLQVSASAGEKALIRLSDLNGRVLLSKPVTLQQGENYLTVDGSSYASGIYILSVSSTTAQRQVKLVKE
ncbi:MAG TPA: kelch repeat-containing protein [Chitinophagaceae bacterium]|nr:kelch repeat-containing protein [Chitinophagaceae bacterium]